MNHRALRLAALSHISKRLTTWDKQARADLGDTLNQGDRVTVYSPLDPDRPIGSITKTRPKPVAKVTDEDALTEWLDEHYPNAVEHKQVVDGSHHEVTAVLAEHAPHLLRTHLVARPWAVASILRASEKAGRPAASEGELDVPGVEVTQPPSALQVVLTADAAELLGGLFRAGLLGLDDVAKELPGGES
jgi:hypothetical protein